jgi:hypothetical protein
MKKFRKIHTNKTHMKTDGVFVEVHTSRIGFNGLRFMFLVTKARKWLGSMDVTPISPWKGWM